MHSLVLSDVAYAFPDTRTLFAGLDLAVGPGLTSLVGRNGAGKSTLLRLIAGELTPSRGSITVDGEPPHPPAVAYLPQLLVDTPPGRTLADELGVVPALSAAARIEAGQGDDAGFRRLRALSGGERLRAALAARLFARPVPQLLVLDEPTNNLDLAGVEVLADALAGWRGALLLVSHDDGFCDRVGVDDVIDLG